MVLTQADKLAKFKAGQYVFRAPPVPHGNWSDEAWINYIDACGGWR